MNLFDTGASREARLKYLDADYQILQNGAYVVCAITAKHIPLDELRYWSVLRQEAYADAAASLEAETRAGALPVRKD